MIHPSVGKCDAKANKNASAATAEMLLKPHSNDKFKHRCFWQFRETSAHLVNGYSLILKCLLFYVKYI